MIFDSHSHYDDSQFNEDRDLVLKEIKEKGVIGVLNCGSDLRGLNMSIELAEKYDFVYAAVGIHPEYAQVVDENLIEQIRNHAKNPRLELLGKLD